jgi:hypothetical protein
MKKYRYLLIAILFIGSASCKKSFLNNVDGGGLLIRQDYIIDLKTTSEYLKGTYTLLGGNLFNGYNTIYPELVADNIKPIVGSNGTVPLGFHYNWNQQVNEISASFIVSSALNCNGFSYGAYQTIRSCNFALEKAEEFRGQDPSAADLIKGQAYTMRALIYFMLVNVFAQPYNFTSDGTHPGISYITSSNWTAPVTGRNTVAEVYTNLIADLNRAIPLLPANSTSTLIMNRNAARGLLARVYLFKGDWVMAKNTARQVSQLVPIMTVNYPGKLFTLQETEALFQIPPAVSATSTYTTQFASVYLRPTLQQFTATADIAAVLNEDSNDARKVWVTPVSTNWNIIKFPASVVPEVSTAAASYYHTVIRSSEMYLTAAEAYAQLNNVDSARFYLDAIRKRANPAAPATTASGTALLEAVYKERRKELAFEGFRMFDLLRWKKGVSRTDALSASAKDLPYPSNKAIAPIPGLDVKVSGFSQNLDY